jgi:DNA polymerase III subunit chi
MNRADFYILPENSMPDRFACTMANKVWQNGNNVYIHSANREAAVLMDDLLWTFNDISFLPHDLCDGHNHGNAPVLIGWNEHLPDNCQVMINLTEDIPATADKFSRIIEIVAGNKEFRQSARNRYRNYRDRGYELHDHLLEKDYDSF